jgi:hypothetical protein
MKKIYLTLLSGLFISQLSTAQTLTQAANEPIVGDTWTNKGWDSVGVVPKTGGAGQTWNFSGFTQNTTTVTSTYQATTAVAGATAFPGATIVENQGGGNYNFFKTAGSSYEMLGSQATGSNFTYTNSAIVANWPVAMGYSVTDAYSGDLTGTIGGTLAGTVTTEGFGTGTISLPGGITLNNVLLLKVWNKVNATVTFPFPTTFTITGTDYLYYHSSQKYPLVRVMYSATTGFTNTTSKEIDMNLAVVTGVNDKNFDATFQIFPNPAKDYFEVNLSNTSNENGVIEIYNAVGQLVQTIALGNETQLKKNVSLNNLATGIYVVKTTLGSKSSSRKLVKE